MNKLIDILENKFAPVMQKANSNIWILTLKDSIMQTLPFIFLGSLFAMLTILNDYFPSLPSFWTPYGWTMGLVGVFTAILIPINYLEKKKLRKQRLNGALTSLILFLIIINPVVLADQLQGASLGLSHSAFGAGGMFVAMISGIITSIVMGKFGKFSFFKEESVIPDFVRAWFDAMLPIGLIVVSGWIVVDIIGIDIFNIIQSIFEPIGNIMQTPYGFVLVLFLQCFIYSMGISTWVLQPLFKPLWLAAILANMAGTAENLNTYETIFSTYLWIGGIGATLSLVILMNFSKSRKLKALGRACIVPSVFNINEPVIFGVVAWNPVMMIGMWLQGIILPIIVYIFTKVIAFAPIPMIQFELWYTPFPLSTWLTTQSFTAVILAVVIFFISMLIWYPFFKVNEKREVGLEAE